QVSRTYFNLLTSQAKLAVVKQTVQRYDTIFMTIRALTLSGLRPGSDSSLAKAELSRNKIVYNQVNEQLRNYREQLSYLTGMAPSLIITDTSLLSEKNRERINISQATSNPNPLIDYYENLKNTYVANERLISKSYLPRVMLTAASWARGSTISYDDKYKSISEGLGYQRYNYLAGISFQYDLFGGIHKRDRLKTYEFEREASELELQQQMASLSSATRQAQNSIDIIEENLLELPIQYHAAADTYNQKVAQYKAGLITLIDLTNAAFVLDRSLNDYVETTGSWYLAQLDKAIATGKLAAFIQSIR
ncbi:MAG: TolC family protein, partial [Bacteroidota bacterium]|nr:TolC family protein [Bacteroidota bacterium]